MHRAVRNARLLPDLLELGLHVQHGGKRGVRHSAECTVDLVLGAALPKDGQTVDCLARSHRCVDYASHEFGVV